jgi:glycosyltransferase involved in cell wall biosynthesis/SAM-dependent methyltransferase
VDPRASYEVLYSTSYFGQSLRGCVEAGRLVLGRVLENYEVGSMLDVGCGIGTWLRAAGELGIKDLVGLDGQYIDLNNVLFDPNAFVATDLSTPFCIERRFDLTVCNEVAEHFPHERGPGFVRDIVTTSDVIVFSAAVPFQGGDNHFNEQWPEYWAILFRKNGFICFDPFRSSIWNDAGVESWYAQNALLYIKEGHELGAKLDRYRADRHVLSRVHPKIFLTNVTRSRPLASATLEAEIQDWHTVVEAYISGATEPPPLTVMNAHANERSAAEFPLSRMRYSDASEIEREREQLQAKLESKFKVLETISIQQLERLRQQCVGLQQQCVGLQQQCVGLQHALADKFVELESLQREFNRVLTSASWQITYPLRAVLQKAPGPGRFLRRALKLVWWTVTLQLKAKLAKRNRPLQAPLLEEEVDNLESLGAFNLGWYGADRLSVNDRYRSVQIPSERHHQLCKERYDAQSRAIVDKYYRGVVPGGEAPYFIRFGPIQTVRAVIDSRLPRASMIRNTARPTYSVVTSYFKHLEFFRLCAISVAALIDNDFRQTGENRIEWVIVNDDPSIDEPGLRNLLPASISGAVRIISDCQDGKNKGVVAPLNEAIRVAANQWLLFLDCDDRIAQDATIVLDHYIQKFEYCRYISSGIVDIDENDRHIRWRRHENRAADMIEVGMVAGHLKAIRRDLFDEIGVFNTDYPGCQDFDLALRASLIERVLLIPEYLYFYRWHSQSQSVDRIEQLFRVFNAIRKIQLGKFVDRKWPRTAPALSPKSPKQLQRGICLIRTQGRRLNLLAEAIQSIADQALPIVPCIIVHGDEKRYELIASWAAGLKQKTILLNASEPAHRRGYPLNVGLDYLRKHADEFDFVCILDDDDIFYPTFSERLANALAFSGCDVAYGLASQRTPWQPPERCHLPMPTACLAVANFIPINSYIVRTDLIVSNDIRFRQDIDYLEDWDFLLSLLEAGASFKFVPETVSEFRVIGDGNVEQRYDPKHFEECQKTLVAHGEFVASKLGIGSFYRGLLEFDFDQRPPLAPWEIGMLIGANQTYGKFSSSASALD